MPGLLRSHALHPPERYQEMATFAGGFRQTELASVLEITPLPDGQ
jgi:hypothetical protein